MKEVIIHRHFNGSQIRQLSKCEFICATDITRVYNEYALANGLSEKRMDHYFEIQSTKDYMLSLCDELNLLGKSKHRNNGVYSKDLISLGNSNNSELVIWTPEKLKFVRRGKTTNL